MNIENKNKYSHSFLVKLSSKSMCNTVFALVAHNRRSMHLRKKSNDIYQFLLGLCKKIIEYSFLRLRQCF